jgi:hypothetical protein
MNASIGIELINQGYQDLTGRRWQPWRGANRCADCAAQSSPGMKLPLGSDIGHSDDMAQGRSGAVVPLAAPRPV